MHTRVLRFNRSFPVLLLLAFIALPTAFVGLTPNDAKGSVITLEISGQLLNDFGTLTSGTAYTAWIQYNTVTPGTGSNPTEYSLDSFVLQVGAETVTADSGVVWVTNDGQDGFEFAGSFSTTLGGDGFGGMQIAFNDYDATLLTDESLPTDLSVFNDPSLDFRGMVLTGATEGADGTVTKVTGSVPEPTSLTLLGLGLAGLAVLRRRRQ